MALGWILIGLVMVVIFTAVFKTQDAVFVFALIKKYMFVFITILLLLFFTFSIFKVSTTNDVDITNFDGIVDAGKLYFAWFASLFQNLGQITGYAVNQDWVLNKTNKTN